MKTYNFQWESYCDHQHLHGFYSSFVGKDIDPDKCKEDGCAFRVSDIQGLVVQSNTAIMMEHKNHEYDDQCWECVKSVYNKT